MSLPSDPRCPQQIGCLDSGSRIALAGPIPRVAHVKLRVTERLV
jgi:hypothetical protein